MSLGWETKICTGCGHVEGEPLGPTAFACCPDDYHIPLFDLVRGYERDKQSRQAMKEPPCK